MTRERSALTTPLRAAATIRRGETAEAQERSTSCRLAGRAAVEEGEPEAWRPRASKGAKTLSGPTARG